jgi:hypothetical protein
VNTSVSYLLGPGYKQYLPKRMQTTLIEIFLDFVIFSIQMLCNLKMCKD